MSTSLFGFMARYRGILVSAFMLITLLAPQLVSAQPAPTPPAPEPAPSPAPAPAPASGGEETPPASNAANDTKGSSNSDCGLFNIGECVNVVVGFFGNLFVQLMSLVAYVAGTLFNFAVVTLVLEFPKYLGNSAGLLAGWGVLRDIGNIVLLFGFVWIGIQTILNIGHFSVGKTLPLLIIFAVLLNFSLLVAEGVIDVSNAFSTALFEQVAAPCPGAAIFDVECAKNNGIASQIFSHTGIASVLWVQGGGAKFEVEGDIGATFAKSIFTALFIIIVAFVLFAGAFQLITRGIVLAFVMVTSPIGFAGMVLPGLDGFAKMWWKALLKNAMFAPVYFLLILLSFKVVEGVQAAVLGDRDPNIADIFSGGGDVAGSLLLFVLVIGFLLAASQVASKFGAFGAEFATKTAGGLSFGTAGFVGRRTIGAGANRLASNIRNSNLGSGLIARKIAGALDYGAKSSFDARSLPGAKNLKLNAGDVSKIAKGGRVAELKNNQDVAAKSAKALADARKSKDIAIGQDIKDAQRKIDLAQAPISLLRTRLNNENKAVNDAVKKGAPAAEINQLRANVVATWNEIKAKEPAANARIKRAEDVKGNAEERLKNVQTNRLSGQDKVLKQYLGGGGQAAEKEAGANNQAESAAAAVAKYMNEAKNHAAELKKLEMERRTATSPAEVAHWDNEIATRQAAAEATDTQLASAQKTKDAADKFMAAVKENKKTAQAQAKVMEDSKYAFEQVARNIDKHGKRLGKIGLGYDLREGARGVRADAGQSKEAKLAHDLQHMLEHASHSGGGHAPTAHTPAPAKGGGGGGHHP